jgi:hypothetical protein
VGRIGRSSDWLGVFLLASLVRGGEGLEITMTSLLDKARATKIRRKLTINYNLEDAELAVAWANEEVSTTQCSKVWGLKGKTNTSIYLRLAGSFKAAVQLGLLKNGK